MKVIDHIKKAQDFKSGPQISYEIVPPPRGRSIQDIIDIVETLLPLRPPWIDVTSHPSHAYYQEKPDGSVYRRTYRKRPGTIGICGIIQNRFKIDTVAHILCEGFTREETEDALIELYFLGIQNVLALKGDSPNYEKPIGKNRSVNQFASDLVAQIQQLNSGKYIDEISDPQPLNLCVGVSGYPEKHFEAANMKTDLQFLKHKMDQGADYIVTQMFFNNAVFHDFVKSCRELGIKQPIIPGLKVIRSLGQLKSIPKTFHSHLPEGLVDEMTSNPKHVPEIGQKWALKQAEDLIAHGHKNLHFYIMNDASLVVDIVKKLL